MNPVNWDQVLNGQKWRLDPAGLNTSIASLRTRAHYEADKRGVFIRTRKVPGTKLLEVQVRAPEVSTAYPSPYVTLAPVASVAAASTHHSPYEDPGFDPDDRSAECVCGSYPRCMPWCVVAGGDGVEVPEQRVAPPGTSFD